MNVNRVLFPTDLSRYSIEALDYAVDLTESLHAELHILYVDDLRDLVALATYSCPSFVASSARVELREQIQALKPSLIKTSCCYHYVEGLPAEEICALADREKIDLIVMASHGRSGLSRVIMGSVAEQVLRKAKCPVLIVKHPVDEAGKSASAAPGAATASNGSDAQTVNHL